MVSGVWACLNGNIRYHCTVNRKLSPAQIEATCRHLLNQRGRVTVRAVMAELRRRHGACGRTERVSEIMGQLQIDRGSQAGSDQPTDTAALLERLRAAEARAERSEEIERRHQDFWAKRYADKADELERRYRAALDSRPSITINQYLRLQQRIAELSRRLAQYEAVQDLW